MVKSNAARLDSIFHALSDSTRRSILRDISSQEKTVGEIAKPYRMTLAAVSKHLKVLESAELIARERRGSFQIVRLNPEPLKPAEQWLAYYEKFWNQRLDALQNILEREKNMSESVALQEKAQSEDLKLQVTRTIKARRPRVFDSWTKPELMQRWFAPGEMTVANASADLRVGGEYRVEMHGVDGFVHIAAGVYKKIVPNEILSFTWGALCDSSTETLVTVEFKDVEGGTELTLTHEHFTSAESAAKHQHGWDGCLDNLEKFIQAQS
ncbi:MAG TPA: metalloregulator ArsR/SmtB family transcription factor [Acidobacteriaceae bacterium]|jgi:uncharacterized protein YndB with AHSA1/START domain/DNA-binding transcriptional ArsR family regulator